MYCANCCYLDYNSHECGRYYCTRKYDYHYADEKSCTYFCDSKYSSDLDTKYRTKDQMNMAIQNSIHSRNEGCYITTIIVHTLGLGDKHKTITTIRNFRNNYLQKNKMLDFYTFLVYSDKDFKSWRILTLDHNFIV